MPVSRCRRDNSMPPRPRICGAASSRPTWPRARWSMSTRPRSSPGRLGAGASPRRGWRQLARLHRRGRGRRCIRSVGGSVRERDRPARCTGPPPRSGLARAERGGASGGRIARRCILRLRRVDTPAAPTGGCAHHGGREGRLDRRRRRREARAVRASRGRRQHPRRACPCARLGARARTRRSRGARWHRRAGPRRAARRGPRAGRRPAMPRVAVARCPRPAAAVRSFRRRIAGERFSPLVAAALSLVALAHGSLDVADRRAAGALAQPARRRGALPPARSAGAEVARGGHP